MSKVDKKKQKLKEQIETLELELKTSLHKKAAGPAISVPAYTSKIAGLRKQLAEMK